MKKKPRKKPLTYLEAVRKNKWGEGDRAMHPEPGKDRYFVTAGLSLLRSKKLLKATSNTG